MFTLIQTINCQRKKTTYEILEVEYRERSLMLDYFTEIGSYLIKFLKDNPTKKIDTESTNLIKISQISQKVYEDLVSYVKEKQKEFKMKTGQMKDKKLFDIFENYNANLSNSNGFCNSNLNSGNNLPFSLSQNNFRQSNLDVMVNNKSVNMNNSYVGTRFNVSQSNQFVNNNSQFISQNKFSNGNQTPHLTTDRYKDEENAEKNNIQMQSMSNNLTNTERNIFFLSNDIISKLESTQKNIINIINDFLLSEREKLEKDFLQLMNHKKIYENLKNTIDNIGVGLSEYGSCSIGATSFIRNYNNSNLLSYFQILEEDKEKIRKEELIFTHKKNIYDKIESVIEDCFIYIKNNVDFESKKEIISDKLLMIKNQIDEYFELYSEIKKSRFGDQPKPFSVTFPKKDNNLGSSSFNLNNVNNSVKIGTSTDFFISQKLKNEGQMQKNNIDDPNNTFQNFFTLYSRKSLHEDLYL